MKFEPGLQRLLQRSSRTAGKTVQQHVPALNNNRMAGFSTHKEIAANPQGRRGGEREYVGTQKHLRTPTATVIGKGHRKIHAAQELTYFTCHQKSDPGVG